MTIDRLSVSADDAKSPVDADFRGTIDGTAVALAGELGPLSTLVEARLPYPVAVKGEVAGRKATIAVKVRRADRLVQLQDIDVTVGSSNVKGRVDIRDEGAKSAWTVNLASSALDVDDLPVMRPAAPASPPAAPAAARRPAFVTIRVLRCGDFVRRIARARRERRSDDRTAHADRRPHARPGPGQVHAARRQARRAGVAGVRLMAARSPGRSPSTRRAGATPALALRVDGRDLDLAALLAAAGVAREVRGGKTNVTVDVTMRGDSPRQWMSGINGNARAVVGPASLVNAKLDPAVTFDRLAEAVNPFRAVNPTTELQCAVIRLPLAAGVAQIDRSIAMETREIDASMSGTVDFRSETIDLSIRPRVRQGIPIEIPADRGARPIRGPFTAPTVSVDAMASAAAIARIGAAIGTSGLSVLAESIFAQSSAGAGACDVALGKAVPATGDRPAADRRRSAALRRRAPTT